VCMCAHVYVYVCMCLYVVLRVCMYGFVRVWICVWRGRVMCSALFLGCGLVLVLRPVEPYVAD